jgi:hypothetical protein
LPSPLSYDPKALGVTILPTLLTRADEVLE